MIKLELQLFAAAKAEAGTSIVSLELDDSATVADMRQRLVDLHPNLKSMTNILLVAVNNEYAADDRILQESDRVACFPPVSGG